MESSLVRSDDRWELAMSCGLESQLPSTGGCSVVEAGHFTAPYPRPTAYFPSRSTLETVEVGRAVTERLHRAGSTVDSAVLLGDLAFPAAERADLMRSELPLDVSHSWLVPESRARNKGKKNFDRVRHKLRDLEASVRFFEASGGLLLRGPAEDGIGFTATPAAMRFQQPPYLATIATAGGRVPLCSLIIAGKLLTLMTRKPDLIIAIYNRDDDINIREKNFWGGCLFFYLTAALGRQVSLPRLVNLTLASEGKAWMDLLEMREGAPPSLDRVEQLLEYLRFASGSEAEPYIWRAGRERAS